MTLSLRLALRGRLSEFYDREYAILERAVTGAIRTHAQSLKGDLRQDVRRGLAGRGSRVANAWRHRVYPTTGASVGAKSIVYSKAPKIIRAFEEGTTLRAKKGRYLAIPTENAPKLGSNRKKIQPSNWPEGRFGKLRFVKTRKGAILVADNQIGRTSRKTGRTLFRLRGERSRQKGQPVVMFILVPQVNPRKRLNVERTVNRRFRTLVDLISANYNRGVQSLSELVS